VKSESRQRPFKVGSTRKKRGVWGESQKKSEKARVENSGGWNVGVLKTEGEKMNRGVGEN